jgi:hypothetical protein
VDPVRAKGGLRSKFVDKLTELKFEAAVDAAIAPFLFSGTRRKKDTYYFHFDHAGENEFTLAIEKLALPEGVMMKTIPNPLGDKSPSGELYQIVAADAEGNVLKPQKLYMSLEVRTDRGPQIHRGDDFGDLVTLCNSGACVNEGSVMGSNEKLIREFIRGKLTEALSASDEKAIGVIARKEAQKLWDDKWEKKILDIVKKELKDVYKGKDFTDAVVKIHKKAQLAYLRLQWEKGRQFTRYDVSAS